MHQRKHIANSTIYLKKSISSKVQKWDPLLPISRLDKQKVKEFVLFCADTYALKSSSASKLQHEFRTFIRWCIENEYIKDSNILDSSVKFKQTNNDPLYLTIDELKAFEKVETNSSIEQNIKDAFLFACYSGLRFSDLKKLKKPTSEIIVYI